MISSAGEAGEAESVTVAFALSFFFTRVRCRLRIDLDGERHRIVWSLVEGDLRKNEGGWELSAWDGGGTLVRHEVEMELALPVPKSIADGLMRSGIRALYRAIRDRAHFLASGSPPAD